MISRRKGACVVLLNVLVSLKAMLDATISVDPEVCSCTEPRAQHGPTRSAQKRTCTARSSIEPAETLHHSTTSRLTDSLSLNWHLTMDSASVRVHATFSCLVMGSKRFAVTADAHRPDVLAPRSSFLFKTREEAEDWCEALNRCVGEVWFQVREQATPPAHVRAASTSVSSRLRMA